VATGSLATQSRADQSATITEVVVTAQRRTERLLDVPISVTVIGAATAQAAGVVSTRDLALVTPGLVGGQTGFAFLPSIRGISSTGTGAGDEANVATYVDNVYIATSGVTAFNLANIDHIEVLKGPQGTLFGRNATGGAIRVVTRDPSFDPHFGSTVSAGFTKPDSREVSVYGSTGITDELAASLDGYYYDDDGYLKNADPNYAGERQGSLNSYLVRGKLLYKPTDRLKIVGEADYGRSVSGVELSTAFVNNVSAFKNIVGVIPALEEREVSTNEQNYDKASYYGGYLNVEYDAEKFTVSSISAIRQSDVDISLDNDRTHLPLNRTTQANDVRTYSEELNWASKFSGPLNFIAGAYFFYEEARNPFINIYAATIGPVTGGVRTVTAPLALTASTFDSLKTESYSAFGEATYRFNDQFSVVGGVRYSIDDKSAYSRSLLLTNSPPVTTDNHWDDVSYRVTANYKPTADSLIYFTNSTGFKSGNINAPTYPYPNQHDQVLPETVTAYELGYKARLFQGLELSASVFHYDYKDIQITTNNALSAAAGRVGINILQNAARGDITGADFELNGRVDPHWGWQLGVSWLPTAEYADFENGLHFVPAAGGLGAVSVASDLSGTRILRSPEVTVNAGLNYQTELAAGTLLISTNYFRTTKMYLAVGEAIEQPAYNVLGAEVGWTDPSGRYTVSLWGRNLTDATYFVSGNVNSGGFAAVWGKPRELGIRVNARY
jgi:iron complex outermembrane receptor protein